MLGNRFQSFSFGYAERNASTSPRAEAGFTWRMRVINAFTKALGRYPAFSAAAHTRRFVFSEMRG